MMKLIHMEKQKFLTEDKFPVLPWHSLDIDSVIAKLNTDHERDLSIQEATSRLQEYGTNTLQSTHKVHWYRILTRQFADVLIWILLVAAAISLVIGALGDAITIMVIFLLTACSASSRKGRPKSLLKL
ncbi:MAG: hypothetical protein E4H21_08775 [Thermodesulfobacteriales bacterium]|jgi:magnesium-transporting ATPase (P-type)|nr:MAG: hypothetical protein E4H21_08775 [Thermodesulfobacteriales bacterium]